MTWLDHIHVGDCRQLLAAMAADGVLVQTCVTSPPYFGLRDYGHADQIGLEQTPEAYVEEIVGVFRAVRDVLRDDGTAWLNLGDSYAGSGRGGHVGNGTSTLEGSTEHEQEARDARRRGAGDTSREAAVTRSMRKARGSQLAPGLHAAAAAGNIGRAWVPPPAGRGCGVWPGHRLAGVAMRSPHHMRGALVAALAASLLPGFGTSAEVIPRTDYPREPRRLSPAQRDARDRELAERRRKKAGIQGGGLWRRNAAHGKVRGR